MLNREIVPALQAQTPLTQSQRLGLTNAVALAAPRSALGADNVAFRFAFRFAFRHGVPP